ncbi:MAG: hypothetical protein ABI878_13270, partial [Acidobacteriota bacterium]
IRSSQRERVPSSNRRNFFVFGLLVRRILRLSVIRDVPPGIHAIVRILKGKSLKFQCTRKI